MNKRIEELAVQAGATVITTHGMEHVVDGCYVIGPARLEKFAKLIVEECIELCAKEHAHSIHTLAGPWNSAIKRCKENIATQFGVEE